MKVLVLGIGKMGYGLLKDLTAQKDVDEVVAADANIEGAKLVVERVKNDKVNDVVKVDVTDKKSTVKFIKGFDIVAAALPRQFCDVAISATIEAGVSWADVAANFGTVFSQHKAAEKAGVTVVPHIGLDVGTDRVLLGVGSRKLDSVDKLYVACGGFPQKGTPGYFNPLRYKISWYWPFAVMGSLGSCRVLRRGKLVEIKVLSECNEIEFPEPLGKLEAFTNGGLQDTIDHLRLKGVKDAYAQTIRWPGHSELWTKLKEMHLLDEDPINIKGVDVKPIDLFIAVGDKWLQYGADEGDAICQRVEVSGKKGGVNTTYTYEFMDFQDFENDISAMARTTAFPCSIVAQMIARGQMKIPGVIHPAKIGFDEKLSDIFFDELSKRHIYIKESVSTPLN